MDDNTAMEACWQQVRDSLEPRIWSVGECATYHGFFNHGWNAAKSWESHMASECQRIADEVASAPDLRAEIVRLRAALQWQVDHYDPTAPEVALRRAKDALNPPNTVGGRPPEGETPMETPDKLIHDYLHKELSRIKDDRDRLKEEFANAAATNFAKACESLGAYDVLSALERCTDFDFLDFLDKLAVWLYENEHDERVGGEMVEMHKSNGDVPAWFERAL